MSDRSDGEVDGYGHGYGADDDGLSLNYEPSQSEDEESGEEENVPDDSDEEESEDEQVKVDRDNIKLCPKHGYGQMTKSCVTCSAAFSLISDKKLIKELSSGSSSKADDLLSRYGGRVDSIKPTLKLDPSTIKLAQNIFTGGVWRDSKLWNDVIKSHLTLTPEQHEELNADIQSESLLRKYRRDSRFKHVWSYQRDLSDGLRNLRIGQRPLLSLIERTFEDLSKIREIGEKAGVEYPDVAPDKVDGVSVPKREVPDKLKYTKHEDVLPRPDVQKFVQENGVSLDTANALITFIESYRKEVADQFMSLYDVTAAHLNDAESLLTFYTNLYGHIDGTFRDLIRNRVASLFRADIKADVLELTSSKKMKDEKATGYFGGSVFLN